MQSWYSITLAEEEHRCAQILCMPPVAWRAEATRMIRTAHRGRTQQAIAFVQKMDAERECVRAPEAPTTPEVRSADDVDRTLWQDMVEEPGKYGDDILEWLDLDEKLRASPKRWRVAAYWLQKKQEEQEKEDALQAPFKELFACIAKEAATVGMKKWIDGDIKRFLARIRNAAVTIQAAVRGHLVRSKSEGLDCCMCLAHTVCPLVTDHGRMCRKCAEQGPYEDILGMADPWNWSRADYKDLTVPEEQEMESCSGCGCVEPVGEMDYTSGYGAYCSRECGPAGYVRDCARD